MFSAVSSLTFLDSSRVILNKSVIVWSIVEVEDQPFSEQDSLTRRSLKQPIDLDLRLQQTGIFYELLEETTPTSNRDHLRTRNRHQRKHSKRHSLVMYWKNIKRVYYSDEIEISYPCCHRSLLFSLNHYSVFFSSLKRNFQVNMHNDVYSCMARSPVLAIIRS